ncbi:GNAT family N-acetyltransferase [Shimia sagamensis]|uniref:Acetyltransferase (GNAT) domain-containing protein n=1 Tax=Shimia sagamensis TaxID=1566352 RepID=A0ABY1NZU6_9RHOB|nr:GNAT family N-acetyltransferase [Shimia sagamensis]SMP20217.1 Acetyltransferase (GNAT) domain-containing protein [Shimia sagamensis]
MSWRAVTEADLGWIEPFLRDHVQSSMFLLGNLEQHGLGSDAPRGLKIWALDSGRQGILGVTNEGMVLPQAPMMTDDELSQLGPIFDERSLMGCCGEAAQVAQILAIPEVRAQKLVSHDTQPHFVMSLEDLRLPEIGGLTLVPLEAAPRDLATSWREAYLTEVPGLAVSDPVLTAQKDIHGYLERNSHRVVMRDGHPVAMTGFNAQTSDVVQIGGVFTPPELRGQGLARAAVALHLAEARDAGKTHATLFAASEAAVRAYESIGFKPCGRFAMAFFDMNVEATA